VELTTPLNNTLDTGSLNILVTEEAIKEAEEYFNSPSYYISPTNEPMQVVDNDVLSYTVAYLTR